MAELLPCPFCGEKPELQIAGNTISIRCAGAFCGMAQIHGPSFDTDSVISAWNTRNDESSRKAERERCALVCDSLFSYRAASWAGEVGEDSGAEQCAQAIRSMEDK